MCGVLGGYRFCLVAFGVCLFVGVVAGFLVAVAAGFVVVLMAAGRVVVVRRPERRRVGFGLGRSCNLVWMRQPKKARACH